MFKEICKKAKWVFLVCGILFISSFILLISINTKDFTLNKKYKIDSTYSDYKYNYDTITFYEDNTFEIGYFDYREQANKTSKFYYMTNNTEILARDYDFPNDDLRSTGKIVNAYTVIMKQSYFDIVSKETSTIEVRYICESAQGLHYLGVVGVVGTISISSLIILFAYLRRNQPKNKD